MTAFRFPHNTCEKSHPHWPVAQPYAFAINMLSAVVLAYFSLVHARTLPVRTTLAVFAVFEGWHAASHAVHSIPYSFVIVHVLGYVLSAAMFWTLQLLSGYPGLPTEAWLILVALVAADIVAVSKKRHTIFPIATGLTILMGVLLLHQYAGALPPWLTRDILPWLLAGTVLVILLLWNEAAHCQRMMESNDRIPYHVIVEILGLVLFVALARTLLRWEAEVMG